MKRGVGGVAVWLLVWVMALAVEAAPTFTHKPDVSREGKGARIEFSVSKPSDVTVAILDGKGIVVKHLAAGVLGDNAPAPFKKGSLQQSLMWDGTDDAGGKLPPGRYTVKVGIGLKPSFDRLLGWDPKTLGNVQGLAVGPGGELFVWDVFGNVHPGDATPGCRVFDRQGKYLRTIIPYPANLSDAKLKGLRRLKLSDGRVVPFLFQGETRSFYRGLGNIPRQRPVATSDGRVVAVGIQEWVGDALRYQHSGPGYLTVVRSDGSVPEPILGPQIAKSVSHTGCYGLALSPDEKTVYITGARLGAYSGKPSHVVYRCSLKDKSPSVFIGEENVSGSDEAHLNNPMWLATDGKGNIYVADRDNDRIAVFKSDGSPLKQIEVQKPACVEVHKHTGAIYVLAGSPPNNLIKLDGLRTARVVAEVRLPNTINGGRSHLWPVTALDDTASPAVLWVGAPTFYCHFKLLRIEDKGSSFREPVECGKGRGLGRNMDVHVDAAHEEVYTFDGLRVTRFNIKTGKRDDFSLPVPEGAYHEGVVAAVGQDGNLYVNYSGNKCGVYRFDRNLKPVPFSALGSNYISRAGSLRLRGRGLTATRKGEVYVLWQKTKEKLKKGDASDANALAVYKADGTLKNEFLIDSEIRSISSVRVDNEGNIYLAVGVRPGKQLVPAELEDKKLGIPWKYSTNSNELNWYALIYGSIVKFGPGGGSIRTGIGGEQVNYGYSNSTEIRGASWIRDGASVFPSWRTHGTPDVCLCEVPCFGLDGFGRSFFPDAARFQAAVIDAAGNEICRFGAYGNQDSAGPDSKVSTPDIPITWVHGIAVSDEAVYLGDRLARRLVRVKLDYADQASATVSIR